MLALKYAIRKTQENQEWLAFYGIHQQDNMSHNVLRQLYAYLQEGVTKLCRQQLKSDIMEEFVSINSVSGLRITFNSVPDTT
jgi:hypothetical protein